MTENTHSKNFAELEDKLLILEIDRLHLEAETLRVEADKREAQADLLTAQLHEKEDKDQPLADWEEELLEREGNLQADALINQAKKRHPSSFVKPRRALPEPTYVFTTDPFPGTLEDLAQAIREARAALR